MESNKSIVEENRNAFYVVNYYDDLSKILENKEQCSYRVFIGTYIPCGATLADKKVQTLADAFNLMEKL